MVQTVLHRTAIVLSYFGLPLDSVNEGSRCGLVAGAIKKSGPTVIPDAPNIARYSIF